MPSDDCLACKQGIAKHRASVNSANYGGKFPRLMQADGTVLTKESRKQDIRVVNEAPAVRSSEAATARR